MVDRVQADIAADPLQRLGQFVIRTSLQGRFYRIPLALPGPIDPLELMLHVEQPDTDSPGQEEDGHLDHQVRAQPDRKACQNNDPEQHDIGDGCAPSLSFFVPEIEQALGDQEGISRPHAEENKGIAVKPVGELRFPRRSQVLLDRQRPDVAHTPVVQIGVGAMVDLVIALPGSEGRKGQQACHDAEDLVGPEGMKKGIVRAVVKDDENPHQEQGCKEQDRSDQGNRVFPLHEVDKDGPQREVGNKRIHELHDGPPHIRFRKGHQGFPQGIYIRHFAGFRGHNAPLSTEIFLSLYYLREGV